MSDLGQTFQSFDRKSKVEQATLGRVEAEFEAAEAASVAQQRLLRSNSGF